MVKTQLGALLAVVAISLVVSGALHFALSHTPTTPVPGGVSAETTASIPDGQ
ncbi:hypothetical protein QO002_004606 [Pararhizobium capsulatum DSM 1112]|uniref:Uncharacterized protein n=1 Tax=Pararhizobium capsulatum DSM 1112 TaxID=1121113 RepID=A0ABU0BY93_9HYPH|nr:hypothetical protein [Pararhizobium capsulatum]MDQ0322400.1 hypothetical protein [Pararhizobium capsulatum DSM 1112]